MFALFTFASCDKSETDLLSSECIRVKVIADICGTAVIQFQDEKHFTLGEKGWSQDGGKTVFDNVAFTVFSCEDMQYLANTFNDGTTGKMINVKVTDNFEMGNCAVCLAIISNPPTKRVNIKIARNGCSSSQNG